MEKVSKLILPLVLLMKTLHEHREQWEEVIQRNRGFIPSYQHLLKNPMLHEAQSRLMMLVARNPYKPYGYNLQADIECAQKLYQRPSASEVAGLLTKQGFEGERLRSMLFLQNAFHYAYFGTPLFADSCEVSSVGVFIPVPLTRKEQEVFDAVLAKYLKYNSKELSLIANEIYRAFDSAQYQILNDKSPLEILSPYMPIDWDFKGQVPRGVIFKNSQPHWIV